MIKILTDRLEQYTTQTDADRENAIKEVLQEVALYALWKADFFDVALFHGGTSLRILHRLPRFSEDLDFMLREPNPEFDWSPYLSGLHETFTQFGLEPEVLDRERMDSNIRKAVIKDSSIVNQLKISFADRHPRKKINIKLKIDIAPPSGSGGAATFLPFPLDHEVLHQDIPSNFALKIHALLCRGFLKGRDWYDFAWYIGRSVTPNHAHLQAALIQKGPWEGDVSLDVDAAWVRHELGALIDRIDWDDARDDVRRFLKPDDLKSLDLWSSRFFHSKLDRLYG